MNEKIVEKKLCNANDIAEDGMKEFEIDVSEQTSEKDKTVKVLLIKQNNRFYCLAPRCSHYSVPLVNGVVYKNRIRCFAHGACFDIRTGDIEDFPGVDCLPKYDLVVDSNRDIYVKAKLGDLLMSKRVSTSIDASNRPCSATSEHRPCSVNLKSYDRLNTSMKEIRSRCLIIGSGAAGLLCLERLREAGYGSNVTMITRESHLPYDRPKLSKALDAKIDSIKLRDEAFFKAHQLNIFFNQEVDRIDFDNRQVHSKSGRTFDYDRLVIATGLVSAESSSAKKTNGVFTLRSYDDATKIHAYFNKLTESLGSERKPNVILVGGSFISMEAASYFGAGGKANVTVMSRRAPFESILGIEVAKKIQLLHESKGVKFFKDEKFDIAEYKVSKTGQLEAVCLKDGSKWPADLVLLAIGSKPATDFLSNTPVKLNKDGYVYVDNFNRTNLSIVYAAGDIAYFPRLCLPGLTGGDNKSNTTNEHVNIAHWGVASSQGRVAAQSIIDSDRGITDLKNPLRVVPFFWSMQFGKSIRFAGLNEKYDKVVFHVDKEKKNDFKFAAFYLNSNGKCIGVCTLDWDPICAVFAECLFNGINVKREHIDMDPNDLKRLLA